MKTTHRSMGDPNLTDTLNNLKTDIFHTLNCLKIGKIEGYDNTRKTATVKIMFQRLGRDGVIETCPLLSDCIVFTLQGGGAIVRCDVKAGDECLVFFSDRNVDNWFANGDLNVPATPRCHDLSDSISMVGINHLGATILGTGKVTIQNSLTSLLDILTNIIQGIQGATCVNGAPLTDTTTKLATAALEIPQLLAKD